MGAFEPKQFGRFYLLEKLAVGGMAEIYKAKTYGAEGFEKLLAIKRILPHCSADKEFIRMLVDEAKLSVLLSHANIVQVYDLGKVGEDFFIAMEYISGVNLRDILYRCRDRKTLIPPELAVYIVSEVCKGLDYAHRKGDGNGQPLGIVHRDISPQNILISFEGEVKIVDFGIAKAAMNISHTMAGILKGKIAYMSPEQALGKIVDYRTDLFSAGIILYECLTGQKLFSGESQFEVLKKIRTTKVTDAKLPETIPAALRQTLITALSYFAKDRFQSAGDMQSDLTRHLYSSYVDFTPQRVAAFVRELFAEEVQRQHQQAQARHQRQQITVSITPAETIVPGAAAATSAAPSTRPHESAGPSSHTPPRGQPLTLHSAIPVPPERSLDSNRFALRPSRVRTGTVVAAACVLIAAIAGTARWWKPWLQHDTTPAGFGTLRVASQPDGAEILLDGKPMGQATPALIEQLQLHKLYTVALTKPGFTDVSQRIELSSETPVNLEMALRPIQGTLVITSEPAGAAIRIDGKLTDHLTPATIAQLAIGTPLQVQLQKTDFQPKETAVTLQGAEPQSLTIILEPSQTVTSIPLGTAPQSVSATATPPESPTTPTQEKVAAPPTTSATPPTTPIAGRESPAVTTLGSLRVVSEPAGAIVYLNGRNTGERTPAVLSRLTVGRRYTIQVKRDGYTGWARTITLRSPETVTISQPLTRAVQPSELPKTTPPSTTPPTREKPPSIATPPTESKPSKSGVSTRTDSVDRQGGATLQRTVTTGNATLTISSKPRGAAVMVDGKSFGRTPLTIRGLAGGQNHSVRLELSGYAPWHESVNIGDGQERMVHAPLERAE
ncbi:MAG: serine/threonine protein kinase [Deltaproteobacteria bacterium]|nr:serine/threonine protein kinase [Deltaproteobacteria bacterium]